MSTWINGSTANRTAAGLETQILGAVPHINAKEAYGAVGDGTTDDTTALQNAIDAALSGNRPLWIPPGTYKVTSQLDMYGNGLQVVGAGWDNTVIRQHTNDTGVVVMGGDYQSISNLAFTYSTKQTGNTSATAIQLQNVFMSEYRNLRTLYAYRGVYMPGSDTAGVGNQTCFNTLFQNIQIIGFLRSGLELRSLNANSTGNVFNNLYIQNNPDGSNDSAADGHVLLTDFDESVFNQLNCEWGTSTDADFIRFVRCKGITINALHCEGLTSAGGDTNRRGLVRVQDASRVVIHGFNALNCTFTTGTAAQSLFRVGVSTNRLEVRGATERNNTVNATTFSVVDFDSSSADCFTDIDVISSGTTTFATNDVTSRPNRLRRVSGPTFTNRVGPCETFSRDMIANSGLTMTSGTLYLSYFTEETTDPITQIVTETGGTGATFAGGGTLGAIGLYLIDSTGGGTLVAGCADFSATTWTSGDTEYVVSLNARGAGLPTTYTPLRNQRYAWGRIIVTSGTTPTMRGLSGNRTSANSARAPRLCATITGQTTLPSSFVSGDLTNTSSRMWASGLS